MADSYADPTAAAELTTVAHLRAWAGLSEEVFDAVTTSTGDLGTELCFIAMLPGVIWREIAARIDPGAGPRVIAKLPVVIWRRLSRQLGLTVGRGHGP